MPASIETLKFNGAMTERGFWLYVWKIASPKGELLYVGRTGDSSSPNASSPFARMGQHFGKNEKAAAIINHLKKKKVVPKECGEFELVAYGPLFPEVEDMGNHRAPRDKVAALEKKLADALRCGEYQVMNTVHSKKNLERDLWQEVREAFKKHFPDIGE